MAENRSDEVMVMNRIDKAWASATSAWHQYQISHGKASSPSQLHSTMGSRREKVREVYDEFADALGKHFIKGDYLFESDVHDIEKGLLSPLVTSLKALCSTSNGHPNPSPELEAETTQQALKAVAMTIRTLERLAERLGYIVRSSEPSTNSVEALSDDSAEIDWCKGALLIQESPSSYQSTMAPPTSQLGKVCKFCYLEISDYRSKADHHTDEDWSALASCHVLACSSFNDRRAAYRCFGCYVSGVSKVYTSAAAMLDHVSSCEEFIEKRTRSRMPPKSVAAGHGTYPSPRAEFYSDSSASSAPATPSTNGTHSPDPATSKPRSPAPPPSHPIPLPARSPPPVPPTGAGHTYPSRPRPHHSPQSIPGTFPTADSIEQSYQPPISPSTSSTQQNSSDPLLQSISTPRKPIPTTQAALPSYPPQHPLHPGPLSPPVDNAQAGILPQPNLPARQFHAYPRR